MSWTLFSSSLGWRAGVYYKKKTQDLPQKRTERKNVRQTDIIRLKTTKT